MNAENELNSNYDPEYLEIIANINSKCGVVPLTNDELMMLALNEISHTYTREERNYR